MQHEPNIIDKINAISPDDDIPVEPPVEFVFPVDEELIIIGEELNTFDEGLNGF